MLVVAGFACCPELVGSSVDVLSYGDMEYGVILSEYTRDILTTGLEVQTLSQEA
jgi:hypothetical protein